MESVYVGPGGIGERGLVRNRWPADGWRGPDFLRRLGGRGDDLGGPRLQLPRGESPLEANAERNGGEGEGEKAATLADAAGRAFPGMHELEQVVFWHSRSESGSIVRLFEK